MNVNEKEWKETEDQDIMMNEGFTSGDGGTAAGGAPYDNMTDEGDTVSCENGDAAGVAGTETGAGAENAAGDAAAASENAAENAAENQSEISPEEAVAIWREKFVRLTAEYDNYRKRTFKEKLDIINAGGEDVVRAMLDVLDDMDRAIAAMAATDDVEAIRQGIMLIDTKLRNTLRGKGLSEIEAVGSELDTDLHEAVARIPAPDEAQKGKIIDVVQKGYKLKDKIIRYAKVVVGQ
ncbi:MAG: nucleotide exchange factor GrpE [Alistipes sp.]|jgi:molecular chaperone GrpE|nr:nucleotide exchange factor GrpE [Alistipes sp.]